MSLKRIGRGFEFDKSLQLYRGFQIKAPKVIAENSLNHFLKGFRKGGGQTDASKGGWAKRGPRPNESGMQQSFLIGGPGSKKGKGKGGSGGALRRSVQILKATFKEIIIGTTRIPYAARHNEGLKGMPQREFIGDSKELNEKNEKLLTNLLGKVFK